MKKTTNQDLVVVRNNYSKLPTSTRTYKVKEIMAYTLVSGFVLVFDIQDIENIDLLVKHLKSNKSVCFYAPLITSNIRELDYVGIETISEKDQKRYQELTKAEKETIVKFLESL